MSVRSHAPFFATLVIFGGTAFAQSPETVPGQTTTPPPGATGQPDINRPGYPGSRPSNIDTGMETAISDKAFVKKAAADAVTEIELGKLAQEKGSSEAVKQYGKRIVEDATRANHQLAGAASKVAVEIPSDLPHGGKKAQEKLAKLSGPDFDRAYAKLALNDKEESVTTFTQEASLGRIPEVREFAAKMLPTIQQHRKMARELEASVKK